MKNTGQILRSKKNGKSRYTPISNDILQSETLTPEEKSILVHLLSLPENWVVYKGQIWKNMNIGRDRFSKHWNGLVEKGYIISIRMIDKESNLIKGWNHVVYEEPVLAENRIDGDSDLLNFSNTDTQLVYKEEIEESNNLTKELTNKEIVFNEFWDMYGKKQAKDAAERAFKSIPISLYDDIRKNIPLFVKQYSDKQFQPYFSTYLNGKRWKDELKAEVKPFVVNNYKKATLDDD